MQPLRNLAMLVALSLLAAACGTISPTPTAPAPSAAAVVPVLSPKTAVLKLRLDKCPLLAGCGASGSVTRLGGAAGDELALEGAGEPEAKGLPEWLEPGSYVVRFRFFTVSDAVVNGALQELPFAACETPVRVMGDNLGEQIDLVVAFADGSCVVTQSSRVAYT